MDNLIRNDFKKQYLENLIKMSNFEEIFNYVHKNITLITEETNFEKLERLRGLRKALSDLNDYINISILSLVNLTDIIDMQITLTVLTLSNNDIKEKEYHEYILKNFNIIFPNYILLESEYKINGIGRIDILAKDINTNREVIIELKTKKQNPTKQLIAYSKNFKNPILIGITEKEIKSSLKIEEVNYFTYKELGINLNI